MKLTKSEREAVLEAAKNFSNPEHFEFSCCVLSKHSYTLMDKYRKFFDQQNLLFYFPDGSMLESCRVDPKSNAIRATALLLFAEVCK